MRIRLGILLIGLGAWAWGQSVTVSVLPPAASAVKGATYIWTGAVNPGQCPSGGSGGSGGGAIASCVTFDNASWLTPSSPGTVGSIVTVATGSGAPSAGCSIPSSTNLAIYWDSTNIQLYYCTATTPTWQKFSTDGGGSGLSGFYEYLGKTSGGSGFAAADVAGTAILYMMPTTNGSTGQMLEDTGSATCGTYATGAPTACHQLAWATPTMTIASGTTAATGSGSINNLGSISTASCATLTVTAANVASTDAIQFTPTGSIYGLTGFVPATTGGLTIAAYPTSGQVNFDVCNWTSGSITPGQIRLNWRVTR